MAPRAPPSEARAREPGWICEMSLLDLADPGAVRAVCHSSQSAEKRTRSGRQPACAAAVEWERFLPHREVVPGRYARIGWVVLFSACFDEACASTDFDRQGEGDAGGATTGGGGITTTPGSTAIPPDPVSCGEAATSRSYVGCDFWPTVTFNPVWSVFDFAVVVANNSAVAAEVKVSRDRNSLRSVVILPGELEKIYLPWVKELKGDDFRSCTEGGRPTASVRVDRGAYHLVSSVPVTVWQFNPLEYKAQGGPPNKAWVCPYPPALCNGNGRDCLSVSNDASLLLPTTAMTGHYRLATGIYYPGGLSVKLISPPPIVK